MQRHVGEAEFIVGLHRDGDFFDGARAVIMAGARDDHVRRLRLARLDEEIVGKAHGLALIESGDVVHAVLLHVDRALVHVAFAAREPNLLLVIQDQEAVAQGLVGLHFEIGVRAFDGAQIAAALLGHVLQVRPGRIAIRHAHVFHVRQIEHAYVEVLRVQRPRFDVVFDAFRQARENKLKARASGLRTHGHLIPLGGALVTRVQAHVLRLQADELRRHHQVGIAPDGNIAGHHLNVVEGSRPAVRRRRPQQSRAMAQESRSGQDQPHQHAQRDCADAEKCRQLFVRNQGFGFGGARHVERIEGQQIEKGLALFERRVRQRSRGAA